MQIQAVNLDEYLAHLPEDRMLVMKKLREVILVNLPKGFEERFSYGMIGYSVPHRIFPAGYHCNPKEPLPLMSIASQKNFIALYHMGLYGNPELLDWFVSEYPKHCKTKLDMGKSCVRFKKPADIPFNLIAELVRKISVQKWIDGYTQALSTHKKK